MQPFIHNSFYFDIYNFIKKETLAQVFSCEFCEISKNTFSYRTPPVAASVFNKNPLKLLVNEVTLEQIKLGN